MANIKSQIKRNRQSEQQRLRNKAVRSRLRTYRGRFDEAVEAGDRAAAEEALRVAMSQYDRAATRGVIHANNAANKKSSMARQLQAL